jgi:hypothetical protein
MKESWPVIAAIVSTVMAASIAFVWTAIATDKLWRETIIEHNAAEWRIDPKTGKKTFAWLTDKESP